MNADGQHPQNLTKNRHDDSSPFWSPDNKQIAFSSDRGDAPGDTDIYIVDVDGRKFQNLTQNFDLRSEEPSWSPDGKHIAFDARSDRVGSEVYVMDADGRNPRKLTDNNWLDNSPSWSPDGKHIAFASTKLANWDIYVIDADGRNPQNLTNNPFAHDRQPVWYRPTLRLRTSNPRCGGGLNRSPDKRFSLPSTGVHLPGNQRRQLSNTR